MADCMELVAECSDELHNICDAIREKHSELLIGLPVELVVEKSEEQDLTDSEKEKKNEKTAEAADPDELQFTGQGLTDGLRRMQDHVKKHLEFIGLLSDLRRMQMDDGRSFTRVEPKKGKGNEEQAGVAGMCREEVETKTHKSVADRGKKPSAA